ncbi:MAG: ligase-associated DNA damage response endonuclease PdeM [Rhodobacteraceae bacterium]|nr:ligase-associated DNA damage response endonuclease PdeM [Paracoccaceae bacterium]
MSLRLDFAGQVFEARPSGVLWWPARQTLIVADLHLGKAATMAARGGALLPPHEDCDTLARLEAEIAALPVARVISLGDGFEDDAAPAALRGAERARLAGLTAGRTWVWVSGNHDSGALPGRMVDAVVEDGIALRHIAAEGPDISGHFHPKARLAGRTRPAFLVGRTHLILPAFGTYTGGLPCESEPLASLVGPGLALLTGPRLLARPLAPPRRRQA